MPPELPTQTSAPATGNAPTPAAAPAQATTQESAVTPPVVTTPAAAAVEAPAPAAAAIPDPAAPVVPADQATVEPAPTDPAATAPIAYDLKAPDGSLLKDTDIQRIGDFAKANNLSKEQAQAVLASEHSNVAKIYGDLNNQAKNNTETWMRQVREDNEMGGANYDRSVLHAQRGLNKYFEPGFVKMLNDTGLGNHPELVRGFSRIGALMADDTAVLPKTNDSVKTKLDVRYDNKGKKK